MVKTKPESDSEDEFKPQKRILRRVKKTNVKTNVKMKNSETKMKDEASSQKKNQDRSETKNKDCSETKNKDSSQINSKDSSPAKDQDLSQIEDNVSSQSKDKDTSKIIDKDSSQTKDKDFFQIKDKDFFQIKDKDFFQIKDKDSSQTKDKDSSQTKDKDSSQTKDKDSSQTKDTRNTEIEEKNSSDITERKSSQIKDKDSFSKCKEIFKMDNVESSHAKGKEISQSLVLENDTNETDHASVFPINCNIFDRFKKSMTNEALVQQKPKSTPQTRENQLTKSCPTCQNEIIAETYTDHLDKCLKNIYCFNAKSELCHLDSKLNENEPKEKQNSSLEIPSLDKKRCNQSKLLLSKSLDDISSEIVTRQESNPNSVESCIIDLAKALVLDCPLCCQQFKSKNSRQVHVKKCGKTKGIDSALLSVQLESQQQHFQDSLEKGIIVSPYNQRLRKSLTSRINGPRVAKEEKQAKVLTRIARLSEPNNKDEEAVQLAVALSLSSSEEDLTASSKVLFDTLQNNQRLVNKFASKSKQFEAPPIIYKQANEKVRLCNNRFYNLKFHTIDHSRSMEINGPSGNLKSSNVNRLWSLSSISDVTNRSQFYVKSLCGLESSGQR